MGVYFEFTVVGVATVAVTFDGKIYTWGSGEVIGQGVCAGRGDEPNPKLVPTLRAMRLSQAACGVNFMICLAMDGRLFSWGRNDRGQLGADAQQKRRFVPAEITSANMSFRRDPVKHIVCGAYHAAALTEKGVMYTWGDLDFGQVCCVVGNRDDGVTMTYACAVSLQSQIRLLQLPPHLG